MIYRTVSLHKNLSVSYKSKILRNAKRFANHEWKRGMMYTKNGIAKYGLYRSFCIIIPQTTSFENLKRGGLISKNLCICYSETSLIASVFKKTAGKSKQKEFLKGKKAEITKGRYALIIRAVYNNPFHHEIFKGSILEKK